MFLITAWGIILCCIWETWVSIECKTLFKKMKSLFIFSNTSTHRGESKLFFLYIHCVYIYIYTRQWANSSLPLTTSQFPPIYFLQWATPRRSRPTKKAHGTVNHRLDAADRMYGYDGRWKNMWRQRELNLSYWWQVSVSAEAGDRWHLTPLNSTSADIPLVSASSPIRIDCSATALLGRRANAVSSSSSAMMALCIDLMTAVRRGGSSALKKQNLCSLEPDYPLISHSTSGLDTVEDL